MLNRIMYRLGVLPKADADLIIRALAVAADLANIERLDRKIDLVIETMAQMVDAAGLNEQVTAPPTAGRAALIERIEALEERADAQDEAWAAWRESRGGKS